MRIKIRGHTWSKIRDDVVLLPPSAQNSQRLCEASQWEAERADRVETAEGVDSDISPV
jgi:hypothetical protein